MSGHLQYSVYGEEDEKPNPQQKRTLRTNQKTLRSKQSTQVQGKHDNGNDKNNNNNNNNNQNKNNQLEEAIQRMHNCDDSDGDCDVEINNAIEKQFQTSPIPVGNGNNNVLPYSGDELKGKLNPGSSKEGFSISNVKYPQYMSSVFQASNDAENKDLLLQKLDHIISLLESQKDERTDSVVEELVLYCFLGIFIIFVVDSFARAGKYVR